MTDPNKNLRGFIVPADERVKTGTYSETLQNLLKRTGIDFFEIVRTKTLHAYDQSVMFVDDDGHQKGLKVNRRAQFFSGYPLDHAIVGDVLFLREVEDPEGMDTEGLTERALTNYFQNSDVRGGFGAWLWSDPVKAFSDHHGLYDYKGPTRDNWPN